MAKRVDDIIKSALEGHRPRDKTLRAAGLPRSMLEKYVAQARTQPLYTYEEMIKREGLTRGHRGGIMYNKNSTHLTFVMGSMKYDDRTNAGPGGTILYEYARGADYHDKGVNKYVRDLAFGRAPITVNLYSKVASAYYRFVAHVVIRGTRVLEFVNGTRTAHFVLARLCTIPRQLAIESQDTSLQNADSALQRG